MCHVIPCVHVCVLQRTKTQQEYTLACKGLVGAQKQALKRSFAIRSSEMSKLFVARTQKVVSVFDGHLAKTSVKPILEPIQLNVEIAGRPLTIQLSFCPLDDLQCVFHALEIAMQTQGNGECTGCVCNVGLRSVCILCVCVRFSFRLIIHTLFLLAHQPS